MGCEGTVGLVLLDTGEEAAVLFHPALRIVGWVGVVFAGDGVGAVVDGAVTGKAEILNIAEEFMAGAFVGQMVEVAGSFGEFGPAPFTAGTAAVESFGLEGSPVVLSGWGVAFALAHVPPSIW
jgi:hypothetical protein